MKQPPRLTPDEALKVEANLGLIHRTARAMGTPDALYEDAFQDGVFGLARAVQLFDPARGFTFSTYAFAWIRSAIQRGRGDLEGADYRYAERNPEAGKYERPMSLDKVAGEALAEGDVTLADIVPDDAPSPEDFAVAADMIRAIKDEIGEDAFADLTSCDTLAEQGRRVGVSRERMRQRRVALRARASEALALGEAA